MYQIIIFKTKCNWLIFTVFFASCKIATFLLTYCVNSACLHWIRDSLRFQGLAQTSTLND